MRTLVFSMLAMASMVACTSESDPIQEVNDKPVEIKMTAGINVVSTKTDGPVQQAAAVDDVVFVRADGTQIPTWTTETVTSLDATIAATSGAISFTGGNPQYYPSNGDDAYLIGYHPNKKGTLSAGIVTYTGLTGQEDIMYASVVNGNKAAAATPLEPAFDHKLTQISFEAKASDPQAIGLWGNITSIELLNQQTGATLALTDGALAFTGTSDQPISILTEPKALTTDVTSLGKAIMVKAGQSEYKIKVITEKNAGVDIVLKDAAGTGNLPGAVSTAYAVTLTFQGKNISATATIGKWQASTGQATVE